MTVSPLFTEGFAKYSSAGQLTLAGNANFRWRNIVNTNFGAGRPLPLPFSGNGVALTQYSAGGFTLTGVLSAARASVYSRRAVTIAEGTSYQVAFIDSSTGTTQVTVMANAADGRVTVYRGTTSGTVLFSSNPNLVPISAWLSLGAAVGIGNTTGFAQVYVNNTLVANLSNVDTQASANATFDTITETSGSGNAMTDFYLADTGDLGDLQVLTGFTVANGGTIQWTSSGANPNWQNITGTLQQATYNSTSTVGNEDKMSMTAMPTSITIYAVSVYYGAWKGPSGAHAMQSKMFSGSASASGAVNDLSSSLVVYGDVYLTDPNTSAAWTAANLNNAQPAYVLAS